MPHYFRPKRKGPWLCDHGDGRRTRVDCSACGNEIGAEMDRHNGRLLLRKVDRGPMFGIVEEPMCVECLIEEAVEEHGYIDRGTVFYDDHKE